MHTSDEMTRLCPYSLLLKCMGRGFRSTHLAFFVHRFLGGFCQQLLQQAHLGVKGCCVCPICLVWCGVEGGAELWSGRGGEKLTRCGQHGLYIFCFSFVLLCCCLFIKMQLTTISPLYVDTHLEMDMG